MTLTRESWYGSAGWMSAIQAARRRLNSASDSSGRRANFEGAVERPCLRLLAAERHFPWAVFGPWERRPLAREAAARAGDDFLAGMGGILGSGSFSQFGFSMRGAGSEGVG